MSLFSILTVFAGQWSFSDEHVDLIYWDQEETGTFWSGVYNKLSYQKYKPCIGITGAGTYCSPTAAEQWEYIEYSVGNDDDFHFHVLQNSDGYYDYKYDKR